MSDSQPSVPQIPRTKPERTNVSAQTKPTRLKFPKRYNARFPAPDDEPFHVDQVEFAAHYFAAVAVLFVSMGGFAAFVLVPLVGTLLSH
jgi:hypothetical protein